MSLLIGILCDQVPYNLYGDYLGSGTNPANLTDEFVYTGEYVIGYCTLNWQSCDSYISTAIQRKIEPVSYPFVANFARTFEGCDLSDVTCIEATNRRILTTDYRILLREQDQPPVLAMNNPVDAPLDLAAIRFKGISDPLGFNRILPHTCLKHTLTHIPEGSNTSISWVLDHTRGRMRYYPFTTNHVTFPSINGLYDIHIQPFIYRPAQGYEATKTILLEPLTTSL